MEPALVSQDGSWHQNMLRKWLDKNNRIHLGVLEEVCRRLIKDSDLCSLHQKEADIMFLEKKKYIHALLKHTKSSREHRADMEGLIKDRKWKALRRFGRSLWYLRKSVSTPEHFGLFHLCQAPFFFIFFPYYVPHWHMKYRTSNFIFRGKSLSTQVGNSHQRCFLKSCSRLLTAVE